MTTTRLRRGVTLLTVAVAALAGVLAAALPASAAARDGLCQSGEFCYYYNSGNLGSVSDFADSLDDYGATQPSCYEFKGAGAGQGLCIKNNAASVWNRTGKTVRVFYNSNYAGAYQDIAAGAQVNLNATLKNNNASHLILGASNGCTTDGTNTTPPSNILVYRVALQRVDSVPFRTYVKNVLPNEWISSWPTASLRSGAMAVKSYGWYWALHSTRKTSWGACYDVRDDTGDQVYKPGTAVASTSAAVDDTWTVRLTRNGNILQAHYCATTTACSSSWQDGNWMSQYGSRDLANQGHGYAYILGYYYDNVVVG